MANELSSSESPQERVDREHESLHCAACGAGNRLSSAITELGWFRCAHCAAACPVAGVGDFVVESPGGQITRLIRPGSSEFRTADGQIIRHRSWLLGLLAIDLAASGLLAFAEKWAPELVDILTPVLVTLVVVAGIAGYWLASMRQELKVASGSVELRWTAFGATWRRRRLETPQFRTSRRTQARKGIELQAPGQRLFVHVREQEPRRWFEREVLAAVKDARLSGDDTRIPCPGCGGPIATETELRSTGAVDCPHCGTSLVETGGGVALPPAEVGHLLDAACGADLARPVRSGDALEWTLPSYKDTHPVSTPFWYLFGVAFDVVLIGGAVFAFLRTPILKSAVALLVIAACGAAVALLPLLTRWLYGRNTYRLERTVLEERIQVGFLRPKSRRVPLARLLRADARLVVHTIEDEPLTTGLIALTLQTATQEWLLEPHGEQKQAALAAFISELPERLGALGRKVELTGKLKPTT